MSEPKAEGRYHHGNLRQALIEAGLGLIAEGGPGSFTLREVAARLNVSRMAPYRHFADKSALLAAIATAGFTKFTAALEHAVSQAEGDFHAQVTAIAIAYVRFAQENRAHFEVMFRPEIMSVLSPEENEIADRSFLVLENLVRVGQQQGYIVPGNATNLAQMMWAMVHGISTLHLGVDRQTGEWSPDFTSYCTDLLGVGLIPRDRALPVNQPAGRLRGGTQRRSHDADKS